MGGNSDNSEKLVQSDLEDEEVEDRGMYHTPRVIQEEAEQETSNQPKMQKLESFEEQGDECIDEEKSDNQESAPSSAQYSRGRHKPQPPIQSGATYPLSSDPRFLVYNLEGQIVSHPNEEQKVVSAQFHNARRKNIPLITDLYDFEIGALSDQGLVLASRGEGSKAPVIMVNVFDSWASNTDWMLTLEEQEQPMCVTIGSCFVAIALKNRSLHIFELSGNVVSVLGLSGDAVALAAYEDSLAVVTHKASPTSFRDQSLSLEVYSVSQRSKDFCLDVVLSPESRLEWIDFSAEGQLCTMDSEGVVWRLNADFGQTWCPIFDSGLERVDQEVFWPVGIKQRKFACVLCNTETKYPKVNPKPFLEMLPLKIPVLSQVSDVANLESENLLYLQEIATCSFWEDEMVKVKTEKSRKLCSLFWGNVKAERFHRAYDVARQMSSEKELQVVLNMAKKSNRSSLVARIEQLIKDSLDGQLKVGGDDGEDRTPLSNRNFCTPLPGSQTGSKRKYQKVENPFTRSTPRT
eukprot:TRINITY_DN2243_c0_g2_i1.p1 TRINITY_DN2243_c0_g2~~TRINITY_DN2243_c0_g2_i1.p1  ORF type:complete len:519 (-),score=77.28 TRINITY_DN2243_c0_g2_i1:130-1686(-)